jgi:hypothetical protein
MDYEEAKALPGAVFCHLRGLELSSADALPVNIRRRTNGALTQFFRTCSVPVGGIVAGRLEVVVNHIEGGQTSAGEYHFAAVPPSPPPDAMKRKARK